ncbi:bifunctional lysylphosphatidylglycerol flippase/synthetase MprF [Leucobacter sp. 7(1)]|uniref:bifunctional lysylphosphatidylglycerol flippase/synthetase MprF n=1 Tax=Leucobacter sp. 7(1) TaxID=1255613 RepID=UPI000B36274E|nr:phosphatidylglycerol lysyltransferase domain-containing protein [Leucobacter sp. 7(1)]
MTDDVAPHAAPAPSQQGPARPGPVTVLRRLPFTLSFLAALLAVGILSGSLWRAASDQPWYSQVATGLPAFAEGRWWTLVTSPFFVDHPLVYLTLLPLVVGGLGWAEWRFGALRTAGLFIAGHLVGVLGAAGILMLVSPSGWHWAVALSEARDVGPSCGALAALVFAIATLRAPWRLRARLAVVLWVGISVLYLGQLHDLEHAVAMVAALFASGWIPAFRHPAGRPSEREWRLLAFAGLIAVGVVQVIDLVVPYNGPLGQNEPVASGLDVLVDVVVIALIANGVRQGIRVAWICALALGAFNLLTAAFGFALVPLLVEFRLIASPAEILGALIAPAALWAALLVILIAGRGAFRVPLRRARRVLAAEPLTTAQATARLRTFGGGTISWMTTWRGNQHVSAGSGAITFQAHAGVAIMLGDPIVAPGEHRAAFQEFAGLSQRAGLIPCAFSASATSAAAVPEGWRSVIVAEDTIVDLPGLAFTGKPWGAVRTAINRASREGIEFRMVRLADEPWSVLAQVRAISEQWTGDKGLPEMRFTLGTVDEALDPEVWVGVAVDAEGSLHGVTSWLPVHGPADPVTGEPRVIGWTLDLMRRRDGGFGPVMEYLIASSAQHFSEQGYEILSLSGAPLVRPEDAAAGPVDQVLEQLGGLIEPLYGFKSLHRFKQKFNPRSESLYLLFRDEGDLPRIGIALTRAYLPDASLRDLVASAATAGKDA